MSEDADKEYEYLEGEEEGWEHLSEEYVQEESILTEYDPEDFISTAVVSPDSSIPVYLLDFEYSYGYDCLKNFNLCACDDSVVCWASGSLVTFLDVTTKQTWFRRTSTGGTVGSITSYRQDPNYRIAIAENREGDKEPIIVMFTWPQMDIDAVLREGTENAYSILDFSPDGEMLASVGKEPDFNLTIWNWKRHKIMLRTSAFTYGVNVVMFSPYCPGQLTTAGLAHIKFWKMAHTFTGLKLKGELGRFGKTEICDVLGVYPMPDEKVLSGCEWGNILVWEAGLVKLEVTQRGRKTCHNGPIVLENTKQCRRRPGFTVASMHPHGLTAVGRNDEDSTQGRIQFMLSPAGDEVTTIAQDGCVRAWYWDTVEQADPPEDDQYVELNPVAETCVPGCQIMCLRHQKDMYWYAQDGNGGIWVVDLELDKLQCNHNKMLTCHAGAVVGMVSLRGWPILITVGGDGALIAYSTETRALVARCMFPASVTTLLYPPIDVDPTSKIIILGFADGIIRTLMLVPERLENITTMIDLKICSSVTVHSADSEHGEFLELLSLLKPHSKAVTKITINDMRTLLVTCGRDSTIFMYKLMTGLDGAPFKLERLGFIETPNNVEYMVWKPEQEFTLLLCGQAGYIMEAVLPRQEVRPYSDITTFKLEFKSFKEILVKKQYLRNRPFPTDDDLASIDEEALKAAAEMEDRDDHEDEEEWLGEVEIIEDEKQPSPKITWAEYNVDGESIWIVQEGIGALLLVKTGSTKLLKYAPFPNAWLETPTTLRFVLENRYLLIGTDTGYIRMVRMPTEDEDNPEIHMAKWLQAQEILHKKLKGRRLAKEELPPTPRIDFVDHYYLAMHDHYTGAITGMEFSGDGKMFYTCGADGNIFSYSVNFDEPLVPVLEIPEAEELPEFTIETVKEPSTVDGALMCHEELKQKEEYDKMMAIANAHKKRVREQLADIASEYAKLIKLNRLMPVSQQIDVTLDPRPLKVQEDELDEAKNLTIRKIAHQLEASDLGLHKMYSRNIIQLDVFPFTLRAIRDPQVQLRPLRQKNLSKAFWDQLDEVYQKMAEAALRMRRTESLARRTAGKRMSWGPPRVASFLLGLPPRPPHPLKKAIRNYYVRLHRHHIQFIEWQEHLHRKPDPNAMPPGAAEALKEAEATIGNKLLKTSPDYVAPPGHNTQLRLCLTRQEVHDMKHEFNEKVVELRENKVKLVARMKKIGERLAEIRMEISPNQAKHPPEVPEIDDDLEFPEKNLEVKPELHSGSRALSKKQSTMGDRRKSISIYPMPRIRQPFVPIFVTIYESKPLAASWELLKARPGVVSTPVAIEIRERRIERHLYEQDMLLAEADVSIQQFDSRLRQLQRERIRVQEKSQLLELHLYQLHREMNVLNRFEAHEDRLAERVYQKLIQVKAVDEQIHDCYQRIDEHRAEKNDIDLWCQDLQIKFKKLVGDNKFADFLRRIFKKKYKPPRDKDDDESESESESSSSSEEDEGSMDSRDIGPIRLDPNICPEGCDKDVYHKTFELRNTRWDYEIQMIEKEKLVDLLKKDIDVHNKTKRKLSMQLDKRKKDLKEFMMEKQSCMNEIDQVVVLRYDQMRARAVLGCTGPEGLSNAVVFDEDLLVQLRRRVLELQEEIRLQRVRMKINRTHLFRMNIDLREMAKMEKEIRAEMREVLTRKLGKPRKVDKTLDDLLRQMARRHKFNENLRIMPPMLAQFRKWRDRHCELEQKYIQALNVYSDRLRLAAALQASVIPKKDVKEPEDVNFGYDVANFRRDVVRLRIVNQQQLSLMKALEDEIHGMRLKPGVPLNTYEPIAPEEKLSEICLFQIPTGMVGKRKKYFPTTPLGSQAKLLYDVNIMKLLYDCLDAMRVSRDDADQLLKELTAELPDILSGAKSRFEVVDLLVRKWLLKHGGDPSQYKKQTRAFDALAALADRLIRQHMEALEGATAESNKVMAQLEGALKDIVGDSEPLKSRLGPALAALFHAAETADIDDDETMTSLVNSLIDKASVTEQEIDSIDIYEVMDDIRETVTQVPTEELEHIVKLAVECLRAQVRTAEQIKAIDNEVERVTQELEQEIHATPSKRTQGSLYYPVSRTSIISRTKSVGPAVSRAKSVELARTTSQTGSKIDQSGEPTSQAVDSGERQEASPTATGTPTPTPTPTEAGDTAMTDDTGATFMETEDEEEGLTPIEDLDDEIDPNATGEEPK